MAHGVEQYTGLAEIVLQEMVEAIQTIVEGERMSQEGEPTDLLLIMDHEAGAIKGTRSTKAIALRTLKV